jgi:hypothetical protein
MKRVVLIALAIGVLFSAQELYAQARKIILFEHFTNASCGPCASQNPLFEQNIRSKNKGNYIHVAYHTVWPGRDPMNAYNKDEVAARVTYYGVLGVPDMVMQGNQYQGGPSGVSQEMLDRASGESSPLRIRVQESSNGTQRTVTATMSSVGVLPAAGLTIRALIIESDISFATPPGSNGEKDFPNVFRRFLNTPAGASFTPAALGGSTELSWTYDLEPANWDTSKVYAVVFVQLDATKEVINAGTRFLPDVELVAEDVQFKKGVLLQPCLFDARIMNFGEADAHVRLSLTARHPIDWALDYTADGTPASGEMDVVVPAGRNIPVVIRYGVGSTAALAEGMFSMASLDDPALTPQRLGTGVISGVTDLLVNNDNSWGSDDGTKAADFQDAYLAGLALAGSSTHAVAPLSAFMRAFDAMVLDEVDHVYFNAGWAFPALTDAFSRAMIGFLGEGGNLFVAGQDVGWDVTDPTRGHGTSTSRAFYRTYLFANYVNDGDSTRTGLRFFPSEILFGGLQESPLENVYGRATDGTPYMYPDQIRPTADGVSIAHYNGDPALIGGVRGAKNSYKTVYLGFGLEQVGDVAVRNEIMKLTWQWFHGIISSVEFDAAAASLNIGQNYPNPASASTVIPLAPASRERSLRLYDITGRLVMTRTIAPAAAQLGIDASALRPGMYYYQLLDGASLVGSRTMQVLR